MSTEPMYAILEDIRQGRCSLFIGSGLSTACGMPSSQEVGQQIAKLIRRSFPTVDEEAIKDNEEDLGKISRLYQEIMKDDFAPHQFVQDRLIQAQNKADMGLYQKLAKIAFPYIITTNYDRLIEQTRKTEIRPRNIIKDEAAAGSATLGRETLLVKMHGDVENYQSMILTEAELHDFRRSHAAVASLVQQILKQGPVLFLGFSKTAGSFVDIAVDYVSDLPKGVSPHVWFIVDRSPIKQLIASLKNEKCVLIEESLSDFIDNLCNAFSTPDFIKIPSDMNIHEVLNRLAFQVKEIEGLLTNIKRDRKMLEAPQNQHIKEIHLLNELEALQTEADMLKLSLEIIEEGIREGTETTEKVIESALEEAKETFEPIERKSTRDADQRLSQLGVGTTPNIGNILDDDIFHKRYRTYLILFKPKYGDESYSADNISEQEDKYAEVLSLWKNNRQAEFFAEYYQEKYHELGKVWPPRGASFPTIEEIQRFVPIENLQKIYSDSVFLQSVKTGLQRLEGALEDNLKYYGDQRLLDADSERPATIERIIKQNIKETRKEIEELKTEIEGKRTERE